jgi:dihydroflavonol-4-reductase
VAKELPGTLRFFKADLLIDGSYRDAMEGCSTVFHTASPFFTQVQDPQRDLVDPALLGTRNILTTVNAVESVERVVLTSSVAAIYCDNIDCASMPNGTMTEAVWNTGASLAHNPYYYSKTLAEKEAWNLQKQQKRWDLVVINPSLVIGPGIDPFGTSESFDIMRQLGDGRLAMGAPDLQVGTVDVRDVAEAHYQAAIRPEAEGRHIVSAATLSILDMAATLQKRYGKSYPFPTRILPKILVWMAAPTAGLTRKFVTRNVGHPFRADNAKSRKALGLNYRSSESSVVEFFQQLVDSGQVKAKR